jgi:YVTN family beta-propeller protein
MTCSTRRLFCTICLVLLLVSSSSSLDKNLPKPGFRIYVTNENSGDLSVIDGSTLEVLATVGQTSTWNSREP